MTTLNITLIPAAAPVNLTTTVGTKAVTLSWDVTSLAIAYEVWRSTTNSSASATRVSTVTTNTYSDTSVDEGTNYFYWVKSLKASNNPSGFSLPSLSNYTLNIWDDTTNTVTTRIDAVKVRVWYTPVGGTATDTGLVEFTTAPTAELPGDYTWTSVGNARLDDGNVATGTSSGAQTSRDIRFRLSDLNIPAGATITGMQVELDGRSTNVARTNLKAYLRDEQLGTAVTTSASFADFAVNDVDEKVTIGSSSNMTIWGWASTRGVAAVVGPVVADASINTVKLTPSSVRLQGLNGGGVQQNIAYDNGGSSGSTNTATQNSSLYGISDIATASTGVDTASDIMTSTGSRFGNIPAYATWYIVTQTGDLTFTGTFTNFRPLIGLFNTWEFSNASVTAAQTVEVEVRLRLRNITDSTEQIRVFSLFKQTGTQMYACQPHLAFAPMVMYPNLSTTPMRILPGKTFRLFVEARKTRTNGSDTIDARCTASELDYSFELS